MNVIKCEVCGSTLNAAQAAKYERRWCHRRGSLMEPDKSSIELPERVRRASLALSRVRGRPTMVLVGDISGDPESHLFPLWRLMGTCRRDEVDLVINSAGGEIKGAYLLIRALRRRFKRLGVFVPFWAKS